MPTPHRSGAPSIQYPLVTPAFRGLNKQAETSLLSPEWATTATNAVFDSAGRLCAREGWLSVTDTPMTGTPVIEQIFEQVTDTGDTYIISSGGLKLWEGTATPTDITGTATVIEGNNWQFVNFVGDVHGFQQDEVPIQRSTGNFSDMVATSGSLPTGNCAVVHSGRIWAADGDKQTIKYCALLDDNHWLTGAGSIDMTSVWPQGIDEIVALALYNGLMVVFGKNRIVLFGDGQGSALGIDPANIYVVDTIVGVGCLARDSVQQVDGGDILFLSAQGIQSLSRLIQERSNPINNISTNVRDYLNSYINGADLSRVRSCYSPENAFYLLSIPGSVTFCFDTSGKMENGALRCTEWTGLTPTACHRALDGSLYLSMATGADGELGVYQDYQDNGVGYTFDFASAWLDIPDVAQYVKILKNVSGLFWVSGDVGVSIKWDFDFQGEFNSRSASLLGAGVAEWGTMEWGDFEWGGGTVLRSVRMPTDGSGQYLRVGVTAAIDSSSFAIQQMNLFIKIGRLAK